jgi:hypothetical protein
LILYEKVEVGNAVISIWNCEYVIHTKPVQGYFVVSSFLGDILDAVIYGYIANTNTTPD